MSTLINNAGVQHYANKMVLAENRKVGSKSLPTALADIDNLIDEMKTQFDAEYGSALDVKLENNKNAFSVGTGTNVDKSSEVENSFTDVELSGNSLVNLFKNFEEKSVNRVTEGKNIQLVEFVKPCQCNLIEGEVYTCLLEISNLGDPVESVYFEYYCEQGWGAGLSYNVTLLKGKTYFKKSFTFKSGLGQMNKIFFGTTSSKIQTINLRARNIMLLKGDWTNREVPLYFEGMKSVGQDDVNGHKIEILSSVGKENLINNSDMYINITDSIQANLNLSFKNKKDFYKVENKIITMSLDIDVENMKPLSNGNKRVGMEVAIECEDGTKKYCGLWNYGDFTGRKSITHTYPSAIKGIAYAGIYIQTDATKCIIGRPKIEISDVATSWCPSKTDDLSNLQSFMNKKEISLNEPLRSTGEVKDTIEKINGEWKLVRRCSEVVLNGSEPWMLLSDTDKEKTIGFRIANFLPLSKYGDKYKMVVCDRFPSYKHNLWKKDYEGITTENNINNIINDTQLQIIISKSELSTKNVAGFKQWLSQNPTRVIYELETPIIEDISPVTLQCWKNGTISIDEVLPVESTHTVALNKPAQIKRNIEELTALRKRVQALEEQYDQIALEQAHQLSLINHSIELDYNI